MTERQDTPSPSSQRASHRRGRGSGGRFRRGRGSHTGRAEARDEGNQVRQPRETIVPVGTSSSSGAIQEVPRPPSRQEGHNGSMREYVGRRGGRRGRGVASQRSVVISHRADGRPSHMALQPKPMGPSALSVEAPEFVPGQPAASSSSGPKSRAPTQKPKQAPKFTPGPKSTAEHLTTRIHEDIEHGQYECVICTNEVVRSSRVWSCSICWTVAHLHCVRKWHTNQTKKSDQLPQQEPQQQHQQNPDSPLAWRCPGCNSTLTEGPGFYHCWCGKEREPKSIAGLPPHTCGQTCSKTRATTCPHPCSLMCHAGPCPPCTLMGPSQTCYCGKHTSTRRCRETDYGTGWSCASVCGDVLPCGEHVCSRPCHAGLCGACEVAILSTCYCGAEQKEMACDQRERLDEKDACTEGSFCCGRTCGRMFDCGHHSCPKQCHPHGEEATHCPRSADVITHCPCGRTPLEHLLGEPRQTCLDPVPRCQEPCGKSLACGHLCPDECHTEACAPCRQMVDIPCRCGRVSTRSICHQGVIEHPWCFRICRAQLNCGRHECGERCCPGEKKAAERKKQKRNANENIEAEHICIQTCGRQLKCGKHKCQQLCHRGPCPTCLDAVFDDISCACGRTVLQPPLPCGTRPPECRFDCVKAQPCRHPPVSHQCHAEHVPCPKCPFLVEKACLCGKRKLKNQPCWFQDARCGLPCGKKLQCGAHECTRTCHRPGECEDAAIRGSHCSQPCGKVRKSCEHGCVEPCHAPFPCKEDTPCQSKIFLTCACQNRKQEVRCGATKVAGRPEREPLRCEEECLRLQRNRRLATALNIDPETHTDHHIPYSQTTLKLFRDHATWAQTQEREFRVFATSLEEKRLRFKPMPSSQRAFLHALADDYGFDHESQDAEPHRHVCLFKTPRFVSAPRKTLAQCVRIVKTVQAAAAASAASAASTAAAATKQAVHQSPSFNALLIRDPRFGLTADELKAALGSHLGSASSSGPTLSFPMTFLPTDEIIIRATPVLTAAAIASSLGPATPAAIETVVAKLKPAVAGTLARTGLAGGVMLCHADDELAITRREGDDVAGAGGWSAVVGKASWRKTGQPVANPEQRVPSSFVTLRKTDGAKKLVLGKKAPPRVDDDWEAAEEKLEGEEKGQSG